MRLPSGQPQFGLHRTSPGSPNTQRVAALSAPLIDPSVASLSLQFSLQIAFLLPRFHFLRPGNDAEGPEKPGGLAALAPGPARRSPRGRKGAGGGGDRSGAGLPGGVVPGRRGLWALSAFQGAGPRLGGLGIGRFEAVGLRRPVPEERELAADGCLRTAALPEREEGLRGGPRGRRAGESRGSGTSLPWVPPPSRGLQTRPLPLGPLVGPSVGRWVSGLLLGSRLSCSEVGGIRERPAHLSRPERSPAPRSVGSPHSPGPLRVPDRAPPRVRCLGNRKPPDSRTTRGVRVSSRKGPRACPRCEDRDPLPPLWPEDWEEGKTPVDLRRISTQPCPGIYGLSARLCRCRQGPGDAQDGQSPEFCALCHRSTRVI